jgi:quercetin dioxygenase-like cupin family protein
MADDAPLIVNLARDGLIPYELDGPEYAALIEWRPISYDEATETGTYFFRMHPGAETAAHTHRGWEEFYVIEGEAIESGGAVIKAGDVVSFAPGTHHSTRSESGCLLIVTERQPHPEVA